MKISERLKHVKWVRVTRAAWRTMANEFGFGFGWINGMRRLFFFHSEYHHFRKLNAGSSFVMHAGDLYPCLRDRTDTTPIDPIYFLQDTWFARKIHEQGPSQHFDIGSSARTMGLIAQFVPVTFVDIRPVEIKLAGFTFVRGSAEQLPFADCSLPSVSSLCVIEHIGLGRYGDAFDARGSEKAAADLLRVLAPGGNLYISVPVDRESRIYFNAHRAFSRDHILRFFEGLTLVEERYIYGRSLSTRYEPARGFGTGLYHLRRS